RYLLTFRPFAALPAAVRRAYLAGKLSLLPCPSSLVFWGTRGSLRLLEQLPLALQIPLLHLFERHEGYPGLRVPQAGWMHGPPAPRGGGDARPPPPTARTPPPHACPGATPPGPPAGGTRPPATTTPWRSSPTKTAWPTCFSARRRTTSACTASRWPATSSCGPRTTACCWTARTPARGPSSTPTAASRRGGFSATASSTRRCAWAGTR